MTWIADAHNDLLIELAWARAEGEQNPFAARWLGPLRAGNVRLQICPIYVEPQHIPETALRRAMTLAAAFHDAVRSNPDDVVMVRTRADLDEVAAGGRIGLVLALEGAEPLGADPELVDVFWELGVRLVGLTWSRRNHMADGSGESSPGGLSTLGEQLVDRLVELGCVVDLAHASERTVDDVLARRGDGVAIVSHAGARALLDTPRNVSDAQLALLAEIGGFVGAMAIPAMIDPAAPTIDRFVDHLEHMVSVAGTERVGLGADFVHQLALSGAIRLTARERAVLPPGVRLEDAIAGLAGPEGFPALVARLEQRGWPAAAIDDVTHGSLLRLLRRALPA